MNAPHFVMTRQDPWEGFSEGAWRTEVNVRDFIVQNYTPYVGDDSFLAGARGVQIGVQFQRRIMTGLFGGEGFIMQKFSGGFSGTALGKAARGLLIQQAA